MTDNARLAALEAVAEAAEILAHSAGVIRGRHPEDADIYTHEFEHIRDLLSALAALDALPAPQPAGETVTLVYYADKGTGEIRTALSGSSRDDELSDHYAFNHIGTTTLRLDPQP